MACNIKEYLEVIYKIAKENTNVKDYGKEALRLIQNDIDEDSRSIVKDFIQNDLIGSKIEIDKEGNLYTIADNKKIKEDPNIKIFKDIEDKANSLNTLGALGILSSKANKEVSRIIIDGVSKGSTIISPRVREWHVLAKRNVGVYRDAVNLLYNNFGDLQVFKSIYQHIFFTETNREKLNEITTIADKVARRNYEILDTLLPKLDKRIINEIKNPKVREDLYYLFGVSGIGSLYEIPDVLTRLQKGDDLDSIIKGLNLSELELDKAQDLKKILIDGKIKDRSITNAEGNKKVSIAYTLLALKDNNEKLYKTFKWLYANKKDLYNILTDLAQQNYDMNKIVNLNKYGDSLGERSNKFYKSYDEHGMLDVFDKSLEFKVISQEEFSKGFYDNKNIWKIIRKPTDNILGIVARESTNSFVNGLGVNINRFHNGVFIDSKYINNVKESDNWLKDNNIIIDTDNGYKRGKIILTKEELDKAGIKKNIAHRLYRTFVHNKELIESQTVRKLIKQKMILSGNNGMLRLLENRIKNNKKLERKDKKEILPFIKTDIPYTEIKKLYPNIARMFKKAENLSNYGDFDKEISLVRKDMEDMVIGHKQSLIFSDEYPNAQKWERYYKQAIQLLKLKLVVANPVKLAVDVLSNTTLLMSTDVGVDEIWKYSKQAITYSDEMSKLEGELVSRSVDLVLAERLGRNTDRELKLKEEAEKKMKSHPYYDALRFGFIQSMGTSMLIKEFDTVSGLQNTIDDAVKKLTTDYDGNPNKLHNAIVSWMNVGFGINDILDYITKAKIISNRKFSDELIEISERLKDKKRTEDTVRYVSEFIAAPSSEVVRQGSRVMQVGDAMARWSLFNSRLNRDKILFKEKYNREPNKIELEKIKQRAGLEALDTFIDYRLNVPKDIKLLSDYGVLMFPSFWMRVQRIIWNLAKYHPLNAGLGYASTDLLGLNGASIIDANVINKISQNTLISPGQNVFSFDTLLLGF